MTLDSTIRGQFPFTTLRPGLSYLDSAAATQMPEPAIAVMADAARTGIGNPHRGLHPLADDATRLFEAARGTVAGFLNARPDEIAFTKNATEALNLAAHTLSESWGENDAVVLTRLEHHSNILPWQKASPTKGVEIRWIGIHKDGSLNQDDIETVFRDDRVRMLAVTGQSNVLGVRPDLVSLIARAKKIGALTCVDAAQLAGHAPIDVQKLGCDLLALSSHKTYGPSGIGALFATKETLSRMPPFLVGGGMVREVHDDGFSPVDDTQRFEAGTQPILSAIGWSAALEWQKKISWKDRIAHEENMIALLLEELRSVKGVRILGPCDASVSGCVSFTVEGIHPHDIAEVLGNEGVCVRAGHQCAQPLHETLGIPASVRASVGLYTNEGDIRALAPALRKAQSILLR